MGPNAWKSTGWGDPPPVASAVFFLLRCSCCCSVVKSCPTLCDPMVCSTPNLPCLSFTVSQSLLRFVSIELLMLPNHLSLCWPLLLLPAQVTCSRILAPGLVPDRCGVSWRHVSIAAYMHSALGWHPGTEPCSGMSRRIGNLTRIGVLCVWMAGRIMVGSWTRCKVLPMQTKPSLPGVLTKTPTGVLVSQSPQGHDTLKVIS